MMLRSTHLNLEPGGDRRLQPTKDGKTTLDKRIIGYDLARALAIFGMVVVNFKIVMGAERNGPDWLVTAVGLLNGRAAATFVVLAGIGLSLLSARGRRSVSCERLAQDRHTLLKRALFLFVAGLLYTPIWPADILHFYGVYLAVAAFLLAAPSRRLWAYSAALLALYVVLICFLDYERGWDWATLNYDRFWTPLGMLRNLFYNGFHPVIPWLAFLLVGMVIGRLNLGDAAVRRRVFLWGAGVGLVTESLSWLIVKSLSSAAGPADREVIEALLGTGPMPPLPLYMLAAGGTACAVIAAAVAFGNRYGSTNWLRPLIATGQLALTLYVAHVILGMGILQALGRMEDESLYFALLASALFCAASVVFAHLWRRRFRRGPLEAIMRRLTDPRPPAPAE